MCILCWKIFSNIPKCINLTFDLILIFFFFQFNFFFMFDFVCMFFTKLWTKCPYLCLGFFGNTIIIIPGNYVDPLKGWVAYEPGSEKTCFCCL